MRKIQFFLVLIVVVLTAACTNEDYNYSPTVQIAYSPVRLNDNATLVVKKVTSKIVKLDSMKIGDTLSVKLRMSGLSGNLKSVKFTATADSSTIAKIPASSSYKFQSITDVNSAKVNYSKNLKNDDIEIRYIARKSSKAGYITVLLETDNSDSSKNMDSLRINTPVKFLP